MQEQRILKVVEAPLVEGAYVAAVESGMGKSIEEVVKAAENASQI